MKNEQNMRKVLKALLKDAPYPVFREDTKAFITKNFDKFTKPMQKEVKGILEENPGGAALCELTPANAKRVGKPKRFFLLEKENDPDLHVYFMLHEFGHYVCSRSKCNCSHSDFPGYRSLAEFHADKYAIEQLLEMNWLPALARAIHHIKDTDMCFDDCSRNPYAVSARRLMKTKLWIKALKTHYRQPKYAGRVKDGKVIVWLGHSIGHVELEIGESTAIQAA